MTPSSSDSTLAREGRAGIARRSVSGLWWAMPTLRLLSVEKSIGN
jgi:hypothetical protein